MQSCGWSWSTSNCGPAFLSSVWVYTVCADLLFTSRVCSVVRNLVFVQVQGRGGAMQIRQWQCMITDCFLNTVLYNSNCLKWCGLRPSVLGQDRSETWDQKTGPCLGRGHARCGLGLVILVLVLIIRSCLHHWQFSLNWTIKILYIFASCLVFLKWSDVMQYEV